MATGTIEKTSDVFVYSEQMTSKVFNGKPVYRTVVSSGFNTGTTDITLSISNLDTVVAFSAVCADGTGVFFAMPYIYSTTVYATMLVFPAAILGSNTLRIVASGVTAASGNFVIEYTKT